MTNFSMQYSLRKECTEMKELDFFVYKGYYINAERYAKSY